MAYNHTKKFYVERENKTLFLIAIGRYRHFLNAEINSFQRSFFHKIFAGDNLESYLLCEEWDSEREFRIVLEHSIRYQIIREEVENYSREFDD